MSKVTSQRRRQDAAEVAPKVLDTSNCSHNLFLTNRLREGPGIWRTNAQATERDCQQPNGSQLIRHKARRNYQTADRQTDDNKAFPHESFFATAFDQPVAQPPGENDDAGHRQIWNRTIEGHFLVCELTFEHQVARQPRNKDKPNVVIGKEAKKNADNAAVAKQKETGEKRVIPCLRFEAILRCPIAFPPV